MEGKTKTANAERCKSYREKNADEYKINDTSRKKRARLLLKTDKSKYEVYKKKERERKQLAKIRKDITRRNEQNHHEHEESLGPSTSFSNLAIKSRPIKKAKKSLPQSPRRKNIVIQGLASKFNVKIQLAEKAGRKKNGLSEEENQYVINFLNRADISDTTPGRRDNVYQGKFNKVKKFFQKRYLLWTIRDIMDIINGSKTVQSDVPSDSFEAKFGKKVTFRQLYDLLKRHKQYVFNQKIPQWSCLCEIYENAIFLANGIKKLLPECRLPETIHELVAKFSCNDTEDCMTGKCEVCSSTKLTCDNLNTLSDSDSMSDYSSDTNEESHSDGDFIC